MEKLLYGLFPKIISDLIKPPITSVYLLQVAFFRRRKSEGVNRNSHELIQAKTPVLQIDQTIHSLPYASLPNPSVLREREREKKVE